MKDIKDTLEFIENRDILVKRADVVDNQLRLNFNFDLDGLTDIVYSEKKSKNIIQAQYTYNSAGNYIDIDVKSIRNASITGYYVFAKFKDNDRNYRFMLPESDTNRIRFINNYKIDAYFSGNHRLAIDVKKQYFFGEYSHITSDSVYLKTNGSFKGVYIREQKSDVAFPLSADFNGDTVLFNRDVFSSLDYGRYELLFEDEDGKRHRLNYYDVSKKFFSDRYFKINNEVYVYYSLNGFVNVWSTRSGNYKPYDSTKLVTVSVERGFVKVIDMPELNRLYLVGSDKKYIELSQHGDTFALPDIEHQGSYYFVAETRGGSFVRLSASKFGGVFTKNASNQVVYVDKVLSLHYPDSVRAARIFLQRGNLIIEGIDSEIKGFKINGEFVEYNIQGTDLVVQLTGVKTLGQIALTVETETSEKTILSDVIETTPTELTPGIFGEIEFNISKMSLGLFVGKVGAYRGRNAKNNLGVTKIIQPDATKNKIAVFLAEKKSIVRVFALSRYDLSTFDVPFENTKYGIDINFDAADMPDVVTAFYVVDLFVEFMEDDTLTTGLIQLSRNVEVTKKMSKFAYLNVPGDNHYQLEPYLTSDKSLAIRVQNDYYNANYSNTLVDENVVLYEAFQGQQIGDSPYAFMLNLLSKKQYKNLRHVWALEPGKEDIVNYFPPEIRNNIQVVTIGTKKYMDVLLRAKYLFNTATFPAWFVKKENQIYVNTWHGTAQKTLGYDMAGGRDVARNQVRNFMMTDYIISPNQHMTGVFADSYKLRDGYDGEILQGGYPRIDLTIDVKRKAYLQSLIKMGMNISLDKPIITIAPTWRGASHLNPTNNSDELIELYTQLSEAFGDYYNIIFKVHQLQYNLVKDVPMLKGYLLPDFVNTNQVLGVTDLLVTDFSSIFFDYLVTNKPIIFYLPDADNYSSERGYYFKLSDLPGKIAQNIGDLKFEILSAMTFPSSENIKAKYHNFKEQFTSYDDGRTTDRYIDYIFEGKVNKQLDVVNVSQSNKKRILIYPGSMMNNGITASFLNLVDMIDYEKYDVTVFIDPQKEKSRLDNIEKINNNIRLMFRFGSDSLVYTERLWNRKFSGTKDSNELLENISWSGYRRNVQRMLPISFDAAIHFSGYENRMALDIAAMEVKNKIIFQHNDLLEDARKVVDGKQKNYDMLQRIFNLYKYFDKIVSVSPVLKKINYKKLQNFVTEDQMTFARNTINNKKISVLKSDNTADLKDTFGQKILFENGFITFSSVGRLSPEKNHANLIDAFVQFHQKYENSQLLIVGDGPLKDALEQKIVNQGAKSFVHLLGQQSNPYSIMERSEAVILPSIHEGQPVVLLEALAMHKSVLASDILPNKGVIGDGEYGFLINGTSVSGILDALYKYMNVSSDSDFKKFDVETYNYAAMNDFVNLI